MEWECTDCHEAWSTATRAEVEICRTCRKRDPVWLHNRGWYDPRPWRPGQLGGRTLERAPFIWSQTLRWSDESLLAIHNRSPFTRPGRSLGVFHRELALLVRCQPPNLFVTEFRCASNIPVDADYVPFVQWIFCGDRWRRVVRPSPLERCPTRTRIKTFPRDDWRGRPNLQWRCEGGRALKGVDRDQKPSSKKRIPFSREASCWMRPLLLRKLRQVVLNRTIRQCQWPNSSVEYLGRPRYVSVANLWNRSWPATQISSMALVHI